MANYSRWEDVKKERTEPTANARAGIEQDLALGQLIYELRTGAGLSQSALAKRMGTTQSAIARMEGGGTRPTLETLEKLATAVGADLVVGVGENLSEHRTIAKLEREGHAVVRRAG